MGRGLGWSGEGILNQIDWEIFTKIEKSHFLFFFYLLFFMLFDPHINNCFMFF
jgi:hypothetical protein